MNTSYLVRTALAALLTSIAGCGALNTSFSHAEVYDTINPDLEKAGANLNAPTPAAYVREVDVRDEVKSRLVNIDAPNIAVTELFRQALPDLPLWAMDGGINPHLAVSINAQDLPFNSFLDITSNITGYDFVFKAAPRPHIEASSVAHRQWSLAAVASARKSMLNFGGNSSSSSAPNVADGDGVSATTSGGSGGGTSSSISNQTGASTNGQTVTSASANLTTQVASVVQSNNEAGDWASIMTFLKSQLATDGKTPVAIGTPDIPPHIVAIRSLGLIDVTGSPVRIREIDRIVAQVQALSSKQIHLSVNVTEVTLNDDRQEGINWTALAQHVQGNMGITAALTLTNPIVGGVANAGTGGLNLGFTKGNQSISNVISLLGQYGKVGNVNRPDVLVLNGKTASINSGQEFSFIQSVQSAINTNSNFQTINPVFQQVLVGVELDVTPRLLDDDHVVLDVVPVLSSLQGFDTFTFSGNTFETPRIALNEMSTEVIAQSGETILLGGLIFRAVSDQIAHLPGDQTVLDKIFGATSTELQRHELVMTITPTLVGI